LRFEPRSIPVTTRELLFDNRWGAMWLKKFQHRPLLQILSQMEQ